MPQVSDCFISTIDPAPKLLTMPNEILGEIFVLSGNLSLLSVCRSFRINLSDDTLCLRVCARIFDLRASSWKLDRISTHRPRYAFQRACSQSLALCQTWFTADFVAKLTQRTMEMRRHGRAARWRRRREYIVNNSHESRSIFVPHHISCEHANFPSYLLRSPFTDEKVALLRQMLKWDLGDVLDKSHGLWRKALRDAIKEHNNEALRATLNFFHCAAVVDEDIFEHAIDNGCDKAILSTLVLFSRYYAFELIHPKSRFSFDYDLPCIYDWLRHRYGEENQLQKLQNVENQSFLSDILDSDGLVIDESTNWIEREGCWRGWLPKDLGYIDFYLDSDGSVDSLGMDSSDFDEDGSQASSNYYGCLDDESDGSYSSYSNSPLEISQPRTRNGDILELEPENFGECMRALFLEDEVDDEHEAEAETAVDLYE